MEPSGFFRFSIFYASPWASQDGDKIPANWADAIFTVVQVGTKIRGFRVFRFFPFPRRTKLTRTGWGVLYTTYWAATEKRLEQFLKLMEDLKN